MSVRIFDAFSDGDGSLTSSDKLSAEVSLSLSVVNVNDPPILVVSQNWLGSSSTLLSIDENPADGAKLEGAPSTSLILTVFDVDLSDNELSLTFTSDSTDNPTSEVFLVDSLETASNFVPYDSSDSPVTSGRRYQVQQFELKVRPTVDSYTIEERLTERGLRNYLDYENLDPITPSQPWKASYVTEDRAFPLKLTASDGDTESIFTLYYKLRDVPESPIFWLPRLGSTQAAEDGRVSDSRGFTSFVKEYVTPVDTTFAPGLAGANVTAESGRLQSDTAEYDMDPHPDRTLLASHAKIDMIHGRYREFEFKPENLVYDPEGDNVTFQQMRLVGYKEKGLDDFESINFLVADDGTVGPVMPDGKTMFSLASPLAWECSASFDLCTLSGQPSYGAPAQLQAEYGSRSSPSPYTLLLEIEASDTVSPDTTTKTTFEMDIEVAGCVDVRASFVACDGNVSTTGCAN